MLKRRVLGVWILGVLGFASAISVAAEETGSKAKPGDSLSPLLPRLHPLEPAEALKSFKLESGFKIELVASEPQVTDPVDIAWDENNRLYVCELWNYPGVPKPGQPLGRVRLLEDADGDGHFEKATIFLDELIWPSGVACWDGGVFVVSSPDLWYFKDTDGDGKADIKRKIYTGFRGQTYEVANCLRWGPANRIYVCGSYAGGSLRPADHPDAPEVSGRDFRFDPAAALRGEPCEAVTGGGEWGNTFDDFGRRFTCDATHLVYHAAFPAEAFARNPFLAASQGLQDSFGQWAPVYPVSEPEPWKVVRERFWSKWVNTSRDMNAGRFPKNELAPHGFATSAAGLTVYRGSALPLAYRGNAFIGEPANNVVIRLQFQPDGVGVTAVRPDPAAKREFLASTDTWFRPVNFANGPDGCLYVVDLYREVVEDDSAIPEDILKHLDLYSGRDRGRIYRIVPAGFKRPTAPRLGAATVGQLVAALGSSPDSWIRETAQRLIYERQEKKAIEPLQQLVLKGEPPQGRIASLHTLNGLGALDEKSIVGALADAHTSVRENAALLMQSHATDSAIARAALQKLADDPEPRIRFAAALSLSVDSSGDATQALTRIAKRDSADAWIRLAILTSAATRAGELLQSLTTDSTFAEKPGAAELIDQLSQVVGARGDPAEVGRVLQMLVDPQLADRAALRRRLLTNLAGGMSRGGQSLQSFLAKSASADPAVRSAIDEFFEKAKSLAIDKAKPETQRAEAVSLLAFAPYDAAAEAVGSLIDPVQPQAVQVAAIRALSGQVDERSGKLLVSKWRGAGPAVRAELTDAIFRRAQRVTALLDAVEKGAVPVSEIDPARRQSLLKSSDKAVQQRAQQIFNVSTEKSKSRQQVVEHYRAGIAKLAGDVARGAGVFTRTCAACHAQARDKPNVAPNLATLQDRSPDTLLANILDPNREVKPIYISYVVKTHDGQDLSGIIASETSAAITLRTAGGKEETVLRANIKRLASTGLSLMPEELESGVNEQQMADLIAYLRDLR